MLYLIQLQTLNHHQGKLGGGERVRTDDLLRARQALSQLSYTPNTLTDLRSRILLIPKITNSLGGPGWS